MEKLRILYSRSPEHETKELFFELTELDKAQKKFERLSKNHKYDIVILQKVEYDTVGICDSQPIRQHFHKHNNSK